MGIRFGIRRRFLVGMLAAVLALTAVSTDVYAVGNEAGYDVSGNDTWESVEDVSLNEDISANDISANDISANDISAGEDVFAGERRQATEDVSGTDAAAEAEAVIEVKDVSSNEDVSENEAVSLDEEAVQTYDISDGDYAEIIEDEAETNSDAEYDGEAPKADYYETDLSLKKGRTTVTSGDTGVVLATAKFSKKTTHRDLSKGRADLVDSSGVVQYWKGHGLELTVTEVKLTDEKIVPGRYTLKVWPEAPEYAESNPASLKITVKAGVQEVVISPKAPEDDAVTLYKQDGKKASFKVTAVAKRTSDDLKPANKKIKWTVKPVHINDELSNALSIKNGVVTVKKGYKVSEHEDYENIIRVKAQACDLGDNGKSAVTYIILTDTTPVPASMKFVYDKREIPGVKNNPTAYYSSEFTEKDLKVYDEKGDAIPADSLKFEVTPKSGFSVGADGSAVVTKAGTYTIKATMKNGSGKSVSAKFKVKNAGLAEEDPYRFHIDAHFGFSDAVHFSSTLKIDEWTGEELVESGLLLPDLLIIYADPHYWESGDFNTDVYKSTASVEVKGAKKVKFPKNFSSEITPNILGYWIPTGNRISVKFSYKNAKGKKASTKTYYMTCAKPEGKINVNKKGYSFVEKSLSEDPFVLKTTGIDYSKYKSFSIEVIPDYSLDIKEKDIARIINLMSDLEQYGSYEKYFHPGADGKSMELELPNPANYTKGDYPMYISFFGKDSEGKNHRLNYPTRVVFKGKDCTPSANLPSKVTVKRNSTETNVYFTDVKNLRADGYGICEVEFLSDVVNGQSTNVNDYLRATVENDGGKYYIKFTREHEIPKNLKSITCRIDYNAESWGKTVKKSQKITITFK
ncbi:MAG: hypothetical protein K6A74_11140 [Lachnospiraceae bacterium]|nr:hypothetical protein [Lachnospiraceae bacterium]